MKEFDRKIKIEKLEKKRDKLQNQAIYWYSGVKILECEEELKQLKK
jgi:predicted HTH domain antitoxin